MSEEQPSNFKITDRRLFNPDGSIRDSATTKEDPSPLTPNAQATSVEPQNMGAIASDADAVAQQQFSSPGNFGEELPAETMADLPPAADEGYEPELDDEDDPASFTSFLMSIASNAAAALGLMEHPATGMRAVDLPLAKHWIDTLGMLQRKTQGNLAPRERQIMEGLLSDMRMQYVSLTSAATQKGPRKFTGSDIIGGR